jgi:hypothetical protein
MVNRSFRAPSGRPDPFQTESADPSHGGCLWGTHIDAVRLAQDRVAGAAPPADVITRARRL